LAARPAARSDAIPAQAVTPAGHGAQIAPAVPGDTSGLAARRRGDPRTHAPPPTLPGRFAAI